MEAAHQTKQELPNALINNGNGLFVSDAGCSLNELMISRSIPEIIHSNPASTNHFLYCYHIQKSKQFRKSKLLFPNC